MRYNHSETKVTNLCPACNYDETYYEPKLNSYFCGSHDCWRILVERSQNAIGPRCANPECRHPWMATARYSEYGDPLFYACDECLANRPTVEEIPYICRDCRHDVRGCTCMETKEFMYGGPVVICDTCHKQTVWLTSQTGTGFAGGRIYFDTFYCGHNIMDESDDMAAAY